MSEMARLPEKIINENGCWIPRKKPETSGYVRCGWMDKNRGRNLHRVVWEAINGPIPNGLTIDHLCRVRNCINPGHLEVVTMRENILRGTGPTAINAKRTHCTHGHPLSGDNLYSYRGNRNCRECARRRSRERHDGKKVGQ